MFPIDSPLHRGPTIKVDDEDAHNHHHGMYVQGQGGNSQNFLRRILKIFINLRCFFEAVIHRKTIIYEFSCS